MNTDSQKDFDANFANEARPHEERTPDGGEFGGNTYPNR